MNHTKLIAATIATAGTLGAGIALAAPAAAEPDTIVRCSPCVPFAATDEEEEPTYLEELAGKWLSYPEEFGSTWLGEPARVTNNWLGEPTRVAGKWLGEPMRVAGKWAGLGR